MVTKSLTAGQIKPGSLTAGPINQSGLAATSSGMVRLAVHSGYQKIYPRAPLVWLVECTVSGPGTNISLEVEPTPGATPYFSEGTQVGEAVPASGLVVDAGGDPGPIFNQFQYAVTSKRGVGYLGSYSAAVNLFGAPCQVEVGANG